MPDEVARAPPRQAGSLPLKCKLQLEELAAGEAWSVARVVSRSLLVSCVDHHVRLNDALSAVVFPDERDPTGVLRARAQLKARSAAPPAELYAPAQGYLGPYRWLGQHLEEMRGRRHALPAFESARGFAGMPSHGSRLLGGVMPKQYGVRALRDLMSLAPLHMSAQEFDALGITTHSPHGTGADMARFMGEAGGFSEPDARALGHWLRDRNAPQPDPRRAPGNPGANAPAGVGDLRGAMTMRYSSGDGRHGERQEQLAVRSKLVHVVRESLARFGRPWVELPAGTADWAILPHAYGEGM